MHSLLAVLTVLFAVSSCCGGFLGCRDEDNRPVDWYINYKLPKISSEPRQSLLYKGMAYAVLNPGDSAWTLSSKSVTSTTSMMGRTWTAFKNSEKSATYLFYNDEAPKGSKKGTAVGHLKGMLAFDGDTGFWLITSVPKFLDEGQYEYPETALTNGQMAICITFKTTSLNDILNQLRFANPNIYARQKTPEVAKQLDSKAKSLFSSKPDFVRKAPFNRNTKLFSSSGQEFFRFEKDNQLHIDLYSELLAPALKTSLVAETWRRGAGTFLEPACNTPYQVVDVTAVHVNPQNWRGPIAFKSTEDHSKWAIALEGDNKWVCVADLNRMASQARRGGGAICFKSTPAWTAFRKLVEDTSMCPAK